LAGSLFSELKRRNVIKVGTAYLVLAWVVIQVTSEAVPALLLPDWVVTFVFFIGAIGFPFALFFAWAFELTPEGLKKESEVSADESVSHIMGRKLDFIIIGLLIIALAYFIFESRYSSEFKPLVVTEPISETDIKPTISTEKSIQKIAILPFFNNKPDPDTDYFGFAIADQIVGDLIYLKNIIVRPSSSVRKYNKKVIDPIVVGNELDTDYILVGSYLKQDNVIRLKVEMVDVSNNQMIWREPIEVNFQNAFELQDLVAKKVVQKLNLQFSNTELKIINKSIPSSPEAYDLYLQSISFPINGEGNRLAIKTLEQSLQLDPDYAPAYSEMGSRLQRLAVYELLEDQKILQIEEYYLKALSLDDQLLSALTGLASYYVDNAKTEKAVELIRKALTINPNDAQAHFTLGYIFRYAGLLKESIMEMETAKSIEPYNPGFRSLGVSYFNIGDDEKALQYFDLDKDSSFSLSWKAEILFRQGKSQQAIKEMDILIDRNPDNLWGIYSKAKRYTLLEQPENAFLAIKKLAGNDILDGEAFYYLASMYAKLGNQKDCIKLLKKAIDKGYINYPFMMKDTFLANLYDDPEVNKLIQIAKQKHLDFRAKFID